VSVDEGQGEDKRQWVYGWNHARIQYDLNVLLTRGLHGLDLVSGYLGP